MYQLLNRRCTHSSTEIQFILRRQFQYMNKSIFLSSSVVVFDSITFQFLSAYVVVVVNEHFNDSFVLSQTSNFDSQFFGYLQFSLYLQFFIFYHSNEFMRGFIVGKQGKQLKLVPFYVVFVSFIVFDKCFVLISIPCWKLKAKNSHCE